MSQRASWTANRPRVMLAQPHGACVGRERHGLWQRPRCGRSARSWTMPTPRASNFAMACTYRGGQSSFVVSGDYVKGEAAISRADGTLAKALVIDFGTSSQPKLAVLLKGQGRLGDWRDLYIIDTGLGTFTHVNEIYADGPDKDPSMVVQVGTCVVAAPR